MDNSMVTVGGGLLSETNKDMVLRLQDRVNMIQHIYRSIMKEGSDYGKIPGCGDKPALLKPGSEKLLLAFKVAPSIEIKREELESGHREYEVVTTLTANDGTVIGEGVGCCSTMESKYRWRTGPKEFTGKPVPKEYWDIRASDPVKAQEIIGGKGFNVGKNPDNGNQWEICIKGERVENTDVPDQYNTVLKMAKKRSIIDACLTVFAASDIFTQDIEDFPENEKAKTANGTPKADPPQRKSETQKPADVQAQNQYAEDVIPYEVEEKHGTNKTTKKPWTCYTIKTDKGDFGTFSDTFAGTARNAIEGKSLLNIEFKTGQYGAEIINLEAHF